MPRFVVPIVIAMVALFTGIFIGRYTTSSSQVLRSLSNPSLPSEPAESNPVNPAPFSSSKVSPASKSNSPSAPDSSENIIAKIKEALTHSGSRHTYATFSKIAESIDEKNVRDVLAFVQTLPKPQEKSMLLSLFVSRWAELDPAAAIAYAQALPPGQTRNWALTSAVTGWAEH